jgi:phosphatidylglycerol:prolipoprotein diacylglycerol transferase
MIFLNGGPIPRHPSQLYEATLEGLVLLIVLGVMVRMGALKRPGLITGSFFFLYGVARTVCEFFREPDMQLEAFTRSTGGLTMGMLLCIPLMIAGLGLGLALAPTAARHGWRAWPDSAPRSKLPARSPGRCLPTICGLPRTPPGYYDQDPSARAANFITAPISQCSAN